MIFPGGTFDPNMFSAIVHLGIPYIIMHIRGTPSNMQVKPVYEDVVNEVRDFLMQQAEKLENAGHHQVIIDPGIRIRENGRIITSGCWKNWMNLLQLDILYWLAFQENP